MDFLVSLIVFFISISLLYRGYEILFIMKNITHYNISNIIVSVSLIFLGLYIIFKYIN